MHKLESLDIGKLIDLLSVYIAKYTRMLSQHITQEELISCRLFIKEIQTEIAARKGEKKSTK